VRQLELLHQALFAQLFGMKVNILQDHGDLHADRRQQVQVLDAEAKPLEKAIHLDDAKAAAVLRDERHAHDRMQIQRGDRMARLIAFIALQVFAQETDPFVESALHDGSAERQGRQVAALARPLGARDQLVAVAQNHQDAVGLRKQLHQLLEELFQEGIDFDGACELLGNLEDDLQPGRRILTE
jgi:hypothetical protein